MTRYLLEKAKRDERSVFLIFPKGIDWNCLKPENALTRVKARSFTEAVTLASKAGIGNGAPIWAMMDLNGCDRVQVIEE